MRPGVPLKQLQLYHCRPLHGEEGLAAALALLPELQHLSVSDISRADGWRLKFPTDALSALQQLTYLELATEEVQGPGQDGLALQPLQALTALAELRLSLGQPAAIGRSMLAGAKHLTCMELTRSAVFGPDALAALTQLRHFEVAWYGSTGWGLGAHLLSQLPAMQQLTHLRCLWDVGAGTNPPVAAFSALTASCSTSVSRGAHCQQVCGSTSSLPAGSCCSCIMWTFPL